MSFKPHPPAGPLLLGYDPVMELSSDHLARLVDRVVDSVERPVPLSSLGQRGYDPLMLAKVLVFAYATGTFSSRRIAQNCSEHLAYLYLTRGDRPCFRTICEARTQWKDLLEEAWIAVLATAACWGVRLSGKVAIDATRIKANASGDLVVSESEYEALLSRLEEATSRAARVDALEADGSCQSGTGVDASRLTVRRVVRSLGKECPEGSASARTLARLSECSQIVKDARAQGLKHVSLSDPDARMMPLGSRRTIGMGHALEAGADSGLLVSGSTTNACSDSGRLVPLVREAVKNDPVPVTQATADSAYFVAEDVTRLQDQGVRPIVPDSTTAGRMRGRGVKEKKETVPLERVTSGADAFRCPRGNVLYRKGRPKAGESTVYRAVRSCEGCPLAQACLIDPKAKRRTHKVRPFSDRVLPYLAQFDDPEFRREYYARGPGIETVFASIRRILGFTRWSVRGNAKVAAEGALVACAYQIRKLRSLTLARA